MNKHYAIIKRNKNTLVPRYLENGFMSGNNKILIKDYKLPKSNVNNEDFSNGIRMVQKFSINDYEYIFDKYCKFKRVIFNVTESTEEIIYWHGIVKQSPLKVGEKIQLNNETFEILEVIKDFDGKVEYYIEELFVAHENYDELYEICHKKYEAFSDSSVELAIEQCLEENSESPSKKKKWYQKMISFIKNEEEN